MFIIACGSIFKMAVFKSFSDNSNISTILLLASVDHFFSPVQFEIFMVVGVKVILDWNLGIIL